MFDLVARVRQFLDPHRLRRQLTRRRRLVAAVLAAVGVLFLIAALRPGAPASTVSGPDVAPLSSDEVAVPVLLRPAAIAGALSPGMVVDIVDPKGSGAPVLREARVLRLPGGGFGPTSEAVAVLAVDEADGLRLASRAEDGVGVIIRSAP